MCLAKRGSPEQAYSPSWPPCSLLAMGYYQGRPYGAPPLVSHFGTLVRDPRYEGSWVWIVKDRVEQKCHPAPSRASHTHLHAGVEGPVHLGLDIHHLADTGERKSGGETSRGNEEEGRGLRHPAPQRWGGGVTDRSTGDSQNTFTSAMPPSQQT